MPSSRSFARTSFFAAALALALAGCDKGGSAPGPAQPKQPAAPKAASAVVIDAAARTEAKEIFSGRCTPCHGEKGAGDGAASATLTPKPRNFQDTAWQKSVTDEHLSKIIQYGGAAVGKAPMMPANPDLTSKPAVVAALVEHIRELGK